MGTMHVRLAEGGTIHLNNCSCAWQLPWHIDLVEEARRWGALQAPGAGETVAALSGYKEIKQ